MIPQSPPCDRAINATDGPAPGRRRRAALARRLRESPLSAAGISVAIHLLVFAVLLKVVWQDRPPPRR
ncbi:MAG TPA: hypothetical protein PLC79_07830 [Phycisphaerae bacterium]|nr:hypothetical protein [Phycisphaerae bacterium]